MSVAYDKLVQHLDEHDVYYQMNSDDRSISAVFGGKVGAYQIMAKVAEEAELFRVCGRSPVIVPPGARPSIAETITRANYGLPVGKFEMDYDDGELLFQTAQILTDDNLQDDVIERLFRTTIGVFDQYLPAVLSVIYGNEQPKDAIQQAEGGGRDEREEQAPQDELPF